MGWEGMREGESPREGKRLQNNNGLKDTIINLLTSSAAWPRLFTLTTAISFRSRAYATEKASFPHTSFISSTTSLAKSERSSPAVLLVSDNSLWRGGRRKGRYRGREEGPRSRHTIPIHCRM